MKFPEVILQDSPDWVDYELLDTGNGRKLERYGVYRLVRPEPQALWKPRLPEHIWDSADAFFRPSGDESGGHWALTEKMPPEWPMQYRHLRFHCHLVNSRHTGVFPEQASNWDWIYGCIKSSGRRIRVLNLFGYTGLASLMAASAGAEVTHVDASRKAIAWGRDNQALSGMSPLPIRWLVDDVFKFIRREIRRQSLYDGLILDPPKFGRGPEGQVWEFFNDLPDLLHDCRKLLSAAPLFIVLTAYAIRASALSISQALGEALNGLGGKLNAGELVLRETSAKRLISLAIFVRWSSQD